MRSAELILLGSLGLTVYAYALYPALVWLVSRWARDPADAAEFGAGGTSAPWPHVTLLIAVRCAEDVIVERLQNATTLNYPTNRLEILIGCDGEEDLTGLLARSFNDSRVIVRQFAEERGKAAVLNDCVPQTAGEIIVFSEADALMQPDALRRLVRHFQDSSVGAVCGKRLLVEPVTGRRIEGLFGRFEGVLECCEARLGALLEINGAICAIRKGLYVPLPEETSVEEFLIGMRVHQQGFRLLYDDSAVATVQTPPAAEANLQRRIGSGAGGFQGLGLLASLLSPRCGWVAFAFWSHKVLRWFCPAFLIAAFVSNACLSNEAFYLRCLLVHELFYLFALTGLFFTGGRWQKAMRLPAIFVKRNAEFCCDFCRWTSSAFHGGALPEDDGSPGGGTSRQSATGPPLAGRGIST